jgi:predicted ester cyclase
MQMWRETEATMTPDELPDLVQQVVDEIWTRGDLELADRLFTPDYINHGGLIPDLVHGPEAIKVSVAMYRLAFPGLRIVVEDLMVDGNTATFRWAAHGGTPSGSPGPAAARRVSMAGGMIVRIDDGRIAESWTSWNQEEALRRFSLNVTSRETDTDFAA